MFLEMFGPKVIDLRITRDRVYLRVGEVQSEGRFWLNLTFSSKDQFRKFIKDINEIEEKFEKEHSTT